MIDIIPAIDLINGSCIRLTQGDFTKRKTYSDDPVAVAKQFEDMGLTRLHLVDLDGAKNGSIANLHILERIAGSTQLKIDFGGGIRSQNDLIRVYNAGATMATLGSMAIYQPQRITAWASEFGNERLLLGADVRDQFLCAHGWQDDTRITIQEFIDRYNRVGLHQIFCTDIGRDGMMAGPATELYRSLAAQFPYIDLIASGGIATAADITSVAEAGCKGVIIGKAFYENAITAKDIRAFTS